jgi:hypothetical protein
MSKISLEKFINNTKGKQIALPNGNYKGQCVSLIQQYISQCLEQPVKARGNAKDWINSYVNEGLGHTVSDQKAGDIIVFPNEADGYGHIAIYISNGQLYDQNNLRHDNGKAGYGAIFSNDYVTLRPNVDVIVNEPKTECDQILRVGSTVRIDRLLTVTSVDAKNNLIGIKELTGVTTASYHWFDPTNFDVVDNNGNKTANQVCNVGCKVKLNGEYVVKELTKTTAWNCKLHIGNRDNWVWCEPCYEVKD